ncbi:TspO/MBR family protein [Altericroceibacterium endophyticum]|uniref:Tryptophan-rich sensory protein n=1 Tax=Altericroceibacterium endophyticum TaxID=1808508 RepID=A0A6I4T7S1_9SPHN|nr:TspO/MBR family protein [Altericroceibacterium endophyticum]MXO66141.1 tryptophan-rich sensory protein [Altericroceibacterium endophyticum]
MNRLASPKQLRASFFRWLLFLVPAVVLLGFLSGQASGSAADNPWFSELQKPDLFPPPATFGIVWSILYIMMGVSFAFICSAWGARLRGWAIAAFLVQLALNLAWSPLFFAAHQITYAQYLLFAIDVMVLVTLILFWKIRVAAGILLVPYLAWVLFATVLNWQFMQLNPHADGKQISNNVERVEL